MANEKRAWKECTFLSSCELRLDEGGISEGGCDFISI